MRLASLRFASLRFASLPPVDEDESGEIDVCEFIEFMTNVKQRGVKGRGGEEERGGIEEETDEYTPVQSIEDATEEKKEKIVENEVAENFAENVVENMD